MTIVRRNSASGAAHRACCRRAFHRTAARAKSLIWTSFTAMLP